MKAFSLTLLLVFLCLYSHAQYPVPLGKGIRTTGSIEDIVYDSINGRTYVGGYFENTAGIEAQNIGMYDGNLWSDMNGGVNAAVSCMTMFNGELYVAGSFTTAGGIPANKIAKWDGTSWNSLGCPPFTSYTVMDIAFFNSELYVTAYSSLTNPSGTALMKWDGNNWQVITTVYPSQSIIQLQAIDSLLYIYGNVDSLNGIPYNSIAAYDGSALIDLQLPSSYAVSVSSLLKFNNSLYAACPGNYLARYNGGQWSHSSIIDDARFLFRYNDSMYVATYSSTVINISSVDAGFGSTLATITESQGINIELNAAVQAGNDLLIGGVFLNVNNEQFFASIKYDGTTIEQFAGAGIVYDNFSNGSYINCLQFDSISGNLYAGGSFFYAGDSIAMNIAAWNGTEWSSLARGLNDIVYDLAVYNDTLYAAGSFTKSGSTTVSAISKWDGQNWLPVVSSCNGSILSLYIYHNDLYAGGTFTDINGIQANRIARYDGTTWSVVGNNTLNYSVWGIADYHDTLIVHSRSSSFSLPGFPDSHFAQLSGNSWSTIADLIDNVSSLYMFKNELYCATFDLSTIEVWKYNGSVWDNTGLATGNGDGGYLVSFEDHLYATSANEGMYRYNGTTWNYFQDFIQARDVYEYDSTHVVLAGFFPFWFDGIKTINLYSIGMLSLTPPSAAITSDRDTICDHQYIQFYSNPTSYITTYEWQFPGGIPSTSTDGFPFVHYNVPGVYDVILKTTNLFGSDSTVFPNAATVLNCTMGSAENTVPSSITVFPNPVNSVLYIASESDIQSIELFNSSGEQVYKSIKSQNTKSAVDCSSFAKGTYIINISTEAGSASSGIVIH